MIAVSIKKAASDAVLKNLPFGSKNMNILQRTNVFFKEVYVELRKVSWLSRKDVIRYTLIVLAVTIIVAAFLGGLDYLFSSLMQNFILR